MFSLQFALTTGILIQCILTFYLCFNKKKENPQPIEQEKTPTPQSEKENIIDSPKKLLKLRKQCEIPVTPFFINKEQKNHSLDETKVLLKRNLSQPFEELEGIQNLENSEGQKKLKINEQKLQNIEMKKEIKYEKILQNVSENSEKDKELDLKEIWKKVNKKEIKRNTKFSFQYQRNERVDISVDALDEKYCLIKGLKSSQQPINLKPLDIDISFSAKDKESPASAQKPLLSFMSQDLKEQQNLSNPMTINNTQQTTSQEIPLVKFQNTSEDSSKDEKATEAIPNQPSFLKKTKSKLNLFEDSKLEDLEKNLNF